MDFPQPFFYVMGKYYQISKNCASRRKEEFTSNTTYENRGPAIADGDTGKEERSDIQDPELRENVELAREGQEALKEALNRLKEAAGMEDLK